MKEDEVLADVYCADEGCVRAKCELLFYVVEFRGIHGVRKTLRR